MKKRTGQSRALGYICQAFHLCELGAGWPWASGIGLRGGMWGVSVEETRCLAGWYGEWGEGLVSHVGVGIF